MSAAAVCPADSVWVLLRAACCDFSSGVGGSLWERNFVCPFAFLLYFVAPSVCFEAGARANG